MSSGAEADTSGASGGPSTRRTHEQIVDEHLRTESGWDMEALMATWGKSPWFDDVAWEEKWYGLDGIREHYEELARCFPDWTIEEKARYVTDEAVILEVVVGGRHVADWRGLPATGRRIQVRICVIYTFDEEGLLELERSYYDRGLVLEQLGLAHDPRKPIGKAMIVATPPFTALRALARKAFRRARSRSSQAAPYSGKESR